MAQRHINKLVTMSDESFGRLRWGLSAMSAGFALAMIMVLEAGV